ncbi:MAG: hypothetical protein IJ565_02920 [Bacilli bacterium]|jgi:hypothetical protein|nr:hypothetical protein [Bacilli bacterium]
MKDKQFKDLRFNITQDMNNMIIEIIVIRQLLKENKVSKKDRKLVEKELKELTDLFVLEFRKNNVEERKLYNDLMNK